MECRVVPDITENIVDALNALRSQYTYVFTTGGIGPTHDDITAAAIAKAFNVNIERHPEAIQLMEAYYADKEQELNEARLKMTEIPVGATLIENAISAAPGFCIENVFALAGIPSIMQTMFKATLPHLKGGKLILSREYTVNEPEGNIAHELHTLQDIFSEADIGSYPFIKNSKPGTHVVCRSDDEDILNQLEQQLFDLIGDRIEHDT